MEDSKDLVRMTVADLVARLQALPQDAHVRLVVGDPNDSAESPAIDSVTLGEDGFVTIEATVWSDDPGAHAPTRRQPTMKCELKIKGYWTLYPDSAPEACKRGPEWHGRRGRGTSRCNCDKHSSSRPRRDVTGTPRKFAGLMYGAVMLRVAGHLLTPPPGCECDAAEIVRAYRTAAKEIRNVNGDLVRLARRLSRLDDPGVKEECAKILAYRAVLDEADKKFPYTWRGDPGYVDFMARRNEFLEPTFGPARMKRPRKELES